MRTIQVKRAAENKFIRVGMLHGNGGGNESGKAENNVTWTSSWQPIHLFFFAKTTLLSQCGLRAKISEKEKERNQSLRAKIISFGVEEGDEMKFKL